MEVVSFTKQGKIDLKLLEKLSGDPIEKAPESEQAEGEAQGERKPRRDKGDRHHGDKGERKPRREKGDKK